MESFRAFSSSVKMGCGYKIWLIQSINSTYIIIQSCRPVSIFQSIDSRNTFKAQRDDNTIYRTSIIIRLIESPHFPAKTFYTWNMTSSPLPSTSVSAAAGSINTRGIARSGETKYHSRSAQYQGATV
ncbi:hypothetical protein IWX50DRAFT_614903 [Phyllosticta citricarpa]|uniref:Uncharacterized protein n=1 Tax=Phyllosticta citricarpa TaxID=55181 RepID=A0ABR1L9E4_9PEZI